jgi:prolyl-tRNA synthetase
MVDERNHCVHCDGQLKVVNAFELASINRLNDYYSRKLQLKINDENGGTTHPWLGTYKIDIHRMISAVAWLRQDGRGLLWPMNMAPYKGVLIVVGKSGALHKQAEGLHQLMSDLLLWDERPIGFIKKIRDADRMGIPIRVIISARTIKEGTVALLSRTGAAYQRIPLNKVKTTILHIWKSERDLTGCGDEV